MPQNHRRSQRLEVLSLVKGTSASGADQVTVLNVSEGGALVRSSAPLDVSDHHEFRFMSHDADAVALVFRARVAHAHPDPEGQGSIAGIEFVGPTTWRQAEAIQRLIDLCTTPPRQTPLFSDRD
ncbi:MAG TPA: PilZ domain-containing protein [Vicinamibacterales bacterium]|nr:PilZ domain-containing protein [Vicinamibacterales bacterium]